MSKFLKLTRASSDKPIYINFDNVYSFSNDDGDNTTVRYLENGSYKYMSIKESAEEIFNMLNGSEDVYDKLTDI